MIRFLKAFAWLRWKLLVNGIKGGRRRDKVERLSRISGLLVTLLVVIGSATLSIVFGFLGFAAGWALGATSMEKPVLLMAVRLTLLVMTGLAILIPLSVGSRDAVAGYRRLLLLPIPRRALHLVEVVASLADPWIVFVIPGILAVAIGLIASGRLDVTLVALAAGILLIVIIGALSAIVSFLIAWLMRSRRRGEMFTLVFVMAISILSILPGVFTRTIGDRNRQSTDREASRERLNVERFERALPAWTRPVPSELYTRALASGLETNFGFSWLYIGGLALEAVFFYWISGLVHRKLVNSVESSGGGRRSRGEARVIVLPGLSPSSSAVALATARNAFRSVRGRLVILMTGPMIAAIGIISRRIPQAVPGGRFLGSEGYLLFGAGIVFSLYAIQAFSVNQFAVNRAGLTFEFLTPVSDEDLVKGNTVGCGMVLSAAIAVCLACSLLVSAEGSPFLWVAVILGGFATFLLVSPAAALLSATFPAASDLSKTGTGGNPHGFAFFLGSLLTVGLSTLSALLIRIATALSDRPEVAMMVLAAWTIVSFAVALPLLKLASRAVASRRENLALVAQGK
jgi:hypothetical protein